MSGILQALLASLAGKDNYKLWGWGDKPVGDGANIARSSPVQLGSDTNWQSISRYQGRAAIKDDNTLWVWGFSSTGSAILAPQQVGALTTWAYVDMGPNHVLAVKTDGTLWAWGSQNTYGQLGLNNRTVLSSPNQVGGLTDWAKVGTGFNISLAVKTNGTLWSWGRNHYGQLGQNNRLDRSSPVQVGALTTWDYPWASDAQGGCIRTNDTAFMMGYGTGGELGQNALVDRSSPVQVSGSSWDIIKTGGSDVGPAQSFGVKTDGSLWFWGAGDKSGAGGTSLGLQGKSGPTQIASFTNAAPYLAGSRDGGWGVLKTDGTLWTWGANFDGQLGHGDRINRSSPTQVGSNTNWHLLGGFAYAMTAVTKN